MVPWGSKDPAWEVAFTSRAHHKAVYAPRSDVARGGSACMVGYSEIGRVAQTCRLSACLRPAEERIHPEKSIGTYAPPAIAFCC